MNINLSSKRLFLHSCQEMCCTFLTMCKNIITVIFIHVEHQRSGKGEQGISTEKREQKEERKISSLVNTLKLKANTVLSTPNCLLSLKNIFKM